jgi:hypothetical protein
LRRRRNSSEFLRFPTGSKKDGDRHPPTFTSARFDDLAEPGGGEEPAGFFDMKLVNRMDVFLFCDYDWFNQSALKSTMKKRLQLFRYTRPAGFPVNTG